MASTSGDRSSPAPYQRDRIRAGQKVLSRNARTMRPDARLFSVHMFQKGLRMTRPIVATLDSESSSEGGLSPWTKTVCGLFFVSGVPALIYQLVWQRALFRIL